MHSLLEERLKALGWQQTAHQLDALVEDASANTLSYFDFLDTLVKQEWDSRESADLQKRIQRAKFPYSKSIHDFDFTFQPSISEQRVKETCTCRFIANGENRILLGPPGVGKTHLAIGFGLEALAKGYQVLFMTSDELGEQCQKAAKKGAMIIASNKSYLEWGKTFGDDVLATAILDRLLHHSVTFNIKGDSYRMEEKKKAGIIPAAPSVETEK